MDDVESRTSENIELTSKPYHTSCTLQNWNMSAWLQPCRVSARNLHQKQKVEIEFIHEDVPSAVPQDTSLCLFRVMQEALHNAVKHSGVRHFEVMVHGSPTKIHLTRFRIQAAGFDPGRWLNRRA